MAATRTAPLLLSAARAKPNAAAAAPFACRLLSPRQAITTSTPPRPRPILSPSPSATGIARSPLARNGTELLLRRCAGIRRSAAGHTPFWDGQSPTRAFSASPLSRSAAATSVASAPVALAPAVGPSAAAPPVVVSETARQAAPEAASAVSTSGMADAPPLRVGDLADMGLASWWTPVGHVQHLIEYFHCYTGLPFWAVIPLSFAAYKAAFLPVLLPAIKNMERYTHVLPAIGPWTEKLRKAKIEKHAAKQLQAAAAVQQLFDAHKVSRLLLGVLPAIEGVCGIGTIWAVRQIINLPVPQLAGQSMFWVTDLSAADPTHVLPFAVGASVFLMNEWKRMHTAALPSPAKSQLFYAAISDILPLVTIPMTWSVSSGILIAGISTAAVYNLQSLIIANPAVRRALNIPLRSKVHPSLRRKRFWTLLMENRTRKPVVWKQQPNGPAK